MSSKDGKLWGIVLAAGEGRRMAPLTRALYGQVIPKQFASFHAHESLLQQTMKRLSAIVPSEQTVVVVGDAYEELARKQLSAFAGADVVAQPQNLGTGPGILLPLSRILARDPNARVLVSPSDHYVGRPLVFEGALEMLEASSARHPNTITLLGVVPDRPAADLGWIVPGSREDESSEDGLRSVHRFIEKPPESMAMLLLGTGALWNTLIMTGSATALWALARPTLPTQTRLFDEYIASVGTAAEVDVLSDIYDDMLPADFSREVLERAGRLAVLTAVDCAWSDWGTPERVFRSLDNTPFLEPLVDRIVDRARAGGRHGRIHAPRHGLAAAHP